MDRDPGRPERRLGRLRRRIARLARAVFGSVPVVDEADPDTDPGLGVREPLRPLTPSLTGGVALDLPDDDGSG